MIEDLHAEGGTLKPGAVLPYRGHLQVSRPGPDAVFAAVHAPFRRRPPVMDIECHVLSDDTLALRISTGDEGYVLLHHLAQDDARFDDVFLQGRAAVVTLKDGTPQSLCLASGTSLICNGAELHLEKSGNAYAVRSGDTFKRVEL